MNRNYSASDNSTMLNQLSDVMKKLAKEVMPKLVQDAHQKSSDMLCQKGTGNWNHQLSTQDITEYTKRASSAKTEDEI